MQEIKYNGPEMNFKKIVVLLVTAALILTLFLTRTCRQGLAADANNEEKIQEAPLEYIFISPYDSLFRQYAANVCL